MWLRRRWKGTLIKWIWWSLTFSICWQRCSKKSCQRSKMVIISIESSELCWSAAQRSLGICTCPLTAKPADLLRLHLLYVLHLLYLLVISHWLRTIQTQYHIHFFYLELSIEGVVGITFQFKGGCRGHAHRVYCFSLISCF